jgi:H+/Cl- antiporter ClcA
VSDVPATLPAPAEVRRSWIETWIRLRRKIGLRPQRETLREAELFLLLAVIIGLISGLAVVLFRIAIDWTRLSVFGSALNPSPTRTLVVPTLGGLIVAFLVVKFFPRARQRREPD